MLTRDSVATSRRHRAQPEPQTPYGTVIAQAAECCTNRNIAHLSQRGPSVAQGVEGDVRERPVRVLPVVGGLRSLELAGDALRVQVIAVWLAEDEVPAVVTRERAASLP